MDPIQSISLPCCYSPFPCCYSSFPCCYSSFPCCYSPFPCCYSLWLSSSSAFMLLNMPCPHSWGTVDTTFSPESVISHRYILRPPREYSPGFPACKDNSYLSHTSSKVICSTERASQHCAADRCTTLNTPVAPFSQELLPVKELQNDSYTAIACVLQLFNS